MYDGIWRFVDEYGNDQLACHVRSQVYDDFDDVYTLVQSLMMSIVMLSAVTFGIRFESVSWQDAIESLSEWKNNPELGEVMEESGFSFEILEEGDYDPDMADETLCSGDELLGPEDILHVSASMLS